MNNRRAMRKFWLRLALVAFPLVPASAQTTNGVIIAASSGQMVQKVLTLGAAQLPIGQGAVSDPIAGSISGDCTMSGTGALTCTKTNGVSFGTAATVALGTSGATIPLNNATNVFSALETFSSHIAVGAVNPTLSSCGTSPAIVGDDKAGQVTMGTGSPTGCVITFAAPYVAAPLCTVSWQATPLASQSYAVSNTALTLTQTGTSSNKVNYMCLAQNGG